MNLSMVVNSSLLAESYTIQRSTAQFVRGGIAVTPQTIAGWGVVSVASDQDAVMTPEGDRITGDIVCHSEQQIFETQKNGAQNQFSDIITWNGQQYRIVKAAPYPNRNYWRAIGVRMSGQ